MGNGLAAGNDLEKAIILKYIDFERKLQILQQFKDEKIKADETIDSFTSETILKHKIDFLEVLVGKY